MLDLISHCRAPRGTLKPTAEATVATECACCGLPGASIRVGDGLLCMICVPAFALDTPDIDTMAGVIWMPQMDQGVLSRLVCAAHAALRPQNTAEVQERARNALDSLADLRSASRRRIGTYQPSVLRETALTVPAHSLIKRRDRLSGLRILALDAWFQTQARDFAALLTLRDRP